MRRVCLDTSAYSYFRRGHPEVVDVIDAARRVFVPAVVLGELRVGFRGGSRVAENQRALQGFLADPSVEVLDVDDEAASIYADLWLELRRAGTPVPTNDAWIAALAIREGTTLLTYDAHFRRIRRVGALIFERP